MTVTSIVSQCQYNLRERIPNRIVASRMKLMCLTSTSFCTGEAVSTYARARQCEFGMHVLLKYRVEAPQFHSSNSM